MAFPHVVNAGKYATCLVTILIPYVSDISMTALVLMMTISSIYCYIWDIYMDWGMLRSKRAGRKYLRY
jgi:hypothetical protein